jgi:hypothetical protein
MSSLASVLVAKAKATPENVVPCGMHLSAHVEPISNVITYEIDSDNQLSLTSPCTFDFGRSSTRSVVRLRTLRHGRLICLTVASWLWRVARRTLGLLLPILDLLRRVARWLRSRVYGRWWHWGVRTAGIAWWSAKLLSWRIISIRRRTAKPVGIVHLTSLRCSCVGWGLRCLTGGQRGGGAVCLRGARGRLGGGTRGRRGGRGRVLCRSLIA